jgi:exodeoxyribonuclease V alpha subunit
MASLKLIDKKELKSFIDRAQKNLGVILAEGQCRALEIAAERRVMVLTGGPGTGKTTTIRAILELFGGLGLNTVLTAPTGRAAKRMSELCSEEAQTVHRLLGMGFNNEIGVPVFQKCADDPLDAEAVILDEASMVDITLMGALLDAMRPDCRLVLVGDADQLPSVGPGNVFSDIIGSGIVETLRLTEIFRQAAQSRIIQNAHRINKGEAPDLLNSGDFFVLQRKSPEKAVETILELCTDRLPKHMGIDASQIQVLSPTRMYETGTIKLNQQLQAALNPAGEGKNEKRFGDFLFREGDKIMQIRNNYDIMWKKGESVGAGIFNGDIGQLLQINNQERTFCVDFDGKLAVYSFDMLTELEPAYALTVHKAQGSEYKAVILSVVKGAPSLLTRSVLYTAVTRAKELLIIVGDNDILCQMAGNDRIQRRYSGLKARLKAGLM